ncbi:MAG: HNH endonuclease [Pantoea sp.]|uniref:HNH endonuclease n=1 Tax=Enterobacter agglomerans TaxID=549 RepID=UPI001CCCA8A7|nr:HNH endonuclease [Pantoea agglomerans]MDU5837743.1 HNH endonuclease [Pantoea sp.]UBN53059.1 HNH endonuclease [Pantoea agglomerans]
MNANNLIWSKYFEIDESSKSGLRWKIDRRAGVKAGDMAGYIQVDSRTSYYRVSFLGKGYRVHRIVYEMVSGIPIQPGMQVDHIDGNGLNNAFSNLRLVDGAVNNRNKRAYKIDKSGGDLPSGVRYCRIRDVYLAAVSTLSGVQSVKYFGVSKYGDQEARRLAINYRREAIEELNKLGAGYTGRHGN